MSSSGKRSRNLGKRISRSLAPSYQALGRKSRDVARHAYAGAQNVGRRSRTLIPGHGRPTYSRPSFQRPQHMGFRRPSHTTNVSGHNNLQQLRRPQPQRKKSITEQVTDGWKSVKGVLGL